MKQLIVGIAVAVLLVGCGKSKEEKRKEIEETMTAKGQTQLLVKQAEMNQREVVAEVLRYMETIEPIVAEVFSERGTCIFIEKTRMLRVEKTWDSFYPKMNYLKSFSIGGDCSIIAGFQDLAFAPNLKDEILTLKIAQEKGKITWICSLTSKNKDAIPKECQ
ncbi:hypothetical protein DM558_04380 [Entomomonas moraniae]|uniref:Uncharacterized protein n=1 Tax=Entomomonas moraniae TaxID=2213226 RepID=A0A3S9XCA8_9GAMM|nr:hypothetical protein [Entomomonas moraniae]AZS50059.1 hypothetical protein DM558_04380 [Entomomonas moraniae]